MLKQEYEKEQSMDSIIGFFSSDARQLYKEDVYRTLALPEKCIIHFRYNQKYIQEDIVSNTKAYIGKEGIIFFVTGNDLSIPEDKREKKNHSIRKVTIKNIVKSTDTGYFHFYLELGDFIDCSITMFESEKFISKVAINQGIHHAWIDRVKEINEYFEDILFFRLRLTSKNGKVINPTYSKLNNDAVFNIDDETEYKLTFSFYDKLEGKSSLNISDSNLIDVYYKECSQIGTIIDDRDFKLMTRSVSQSKSPSSLRISPKPKEHLKYALDYEVVTFFEIRKRWSSTLIFGVYSTLAFIAIILSQIVGVYVKNGTPFWPTFWLTAISAVTFGIAGSLLYQQFNKK